MKKIWWVSCKKFTCIVEVDKFNHIVGGAPIIKRYKGQPLTKMMIENRVDRISIIRTKDDEKNKTT